MTPVLAVVKELYKLEPNLSVRFFCDKAFEQQARGLMQSAPIAVDVKVISAGKFRRYSHLTLFQHLKVPHVVFGNFKDGFKIMIGFWQSFFILLFQRPNVVFAKGGYVSLPFGLAASMLRIPLVIHDSDMRPGLTNRVLARHATMITTGAPLKYYPYPAAKSRYVGVPVGDGFRPVDDQTARIYKKELGFDPDSLLVVATGGGLGAVSINRAICQSARALAGQNISAYLVAGKKNYDDAARNAPSSQESFKVVPFVYDGLSQILGAADIVVTRTSATTMQELAGLKKAVITVPAKQLGDQLKNATEYKAAGAVIVVQDDELTDTLADQIILLARDKGRRQELADKLHLFYRPDAASDTADIITKVASRQSGMK